MSQPARSRYRITTAAGVVYVGPVQGSGGEISGKHGIARLQRSAACAAAGDPIVGMYEPEPGHVLVYVGSCAFNDGTRTHVPIVGATFELLSDDESNEIARTFNEIARAADQTPGDTEDERLAASRSAAAYAGKYVADEGPRDASDDDIERVLSGCARRPPIALYAAIREYVARHHALEAAQATIYDRVSDGLMSEEAGEAACAELRRDPSLVAMTNILLGSA